MVTQTNKKNYGWNTPVTISGSTSAMGWFESAGTHMDENITIDITLKDGTEKDLSFKEYMMFVAYWRMLPSDCKDAHEYEKRVLAMRL